jgi:hypothetical protein
MADVRRYAGGMVVSGVDTAMAAGKPKSKAILAREKRSL